MIIQSLSFYLFAGITVAAAVMVISARNPFIRCFFSFWHFLIPPGYSFFWERNFSQ